MTSWWWFIKFNRKTRKLTEKSVNAETAAAATTTSEKWNRNFQMENYLAIQITMLQCIGMWPVKYENYLPNQLAILSQPLNFLFFFFMNFLALHMAILNGITLNQKFQYGTLDEITGVFTMFVIYSFTYFTIIYFELRHGKCAAFVNYMNENFRSRSAKGISYVTAEPTYKWARQFSIFWFIICIMGVLHWGLYPFYVNERILPFSLWYPFDQYQTPYYEIVYILQVLGQITVGLGFGNAGIIILCSVVNVCGQYDILFCSLKNVLYTAMLKNGKELSKLRKIQQDYNFDDEEQNQYYYSYEMLENLNDENIILTNLHKNERKRLPQDNYLMKYDDESRDALTDCVQHHLALSNFCQLLEEFFNPFILIKSIQMTFQICNIAFTVSKTVGSVVKYINLGEYFLLTVLELYLFSYSGDTLKEQSIRISDALLRSPWYLCGGPFRRGMLIMLNNSVKPMIISGGKFFTLDFQKLTAIIKASFSYFTLLQKIGDK